MKYTLNQRHDFMPISRRVLRHPPSPVPKLFLEYEDELSHLHKMADIQNANPTILNAADIPSRLRPAPTGKSGSSGLGIFTQPLPDSNDPFSMSALSSSESESDDELMEEPIDEQEIFGKPSAPPSNFLLQTL